MSAEASFRTRYGFCHLFADRIVLTEGEGVGTSQQLEKEQTRTRKTLYFVFYTLLCGGMGWFFLDGHKGLGALIMGLIWGYFAYFFVRNFRISSPPVILRARIKNVTLKKASRLLGNPFFVVHYYDDAGNPAKRYIAMQSAADGGQEEIEKAIVIWKSAQLFADPLS